MLVLQPFLQSDLGLMMFKPGKTLLSELAKMSQGNRLVVMPLPDELVNVPSGKLNRPVVPDSTNSLVGDKRLLEFFTYPTVRRRLGDFNLWVERIPHCQLSDGEYCDQNLTVLECGRGAIRLCWHHDNQYRDALNERCIELAERNVMLFSLERVRQQLRLEQSRAVSLQELGWWSILNGVYEYLPDSVITELLGNKRKSNRVTLSQRRESDERFDDNGKADLDSRVKSISLTIDPEPPAMFMARPKELTWHSEKYLQFVRSLPCVITGKTEGVVAHHLIGHGEGKMGGKTHDLFTMPMAADEHRRFHDDPKGWETQHGSQLFYVKQTIKRALELGALG